MPKFKVLSPINHDGETYVIDSYIELSTKAAIQLLEVGAITLKEAEVAAATAPTDPAERLSAIKLVIPTLDVNDKTLWTKHGSPTGPALSALLGWPVAAGERDQAWGELNQAAGQ